MTIWSPPCTAAARPRLALCPYRRRRPGQSASSGRPRASASLSASNGVARGRQPEVLAAYRDADLFVLAAKIGRDADRDGLPNVLMEAQSKASPASRRSCRESANWSRTAAPACCAADNSRRCGDCRSADPRSVAARPARRRGRGAGAAGFRHGVRHCRAAALFGLPEPVRDTGGGCRQTDRPIDRSHADAFYAPLKPPDHPMPSATAGSRSCCGRRSRRGTTVSGSRLRSYDGTGDKLRQARLARIAHGAAERLLRRWRQNPGRSRAVVHLPPLLQGPRLAGPDHQHALGIPTSSPKILGAEAGWRELADRPPRRSKRPCAAPTRCSASTPATASASCRCAIRGAGSRCRPFLDIRRYGRARGPPALIAARLIAVAMMRHGDKARLLPVLGAALADLLRGPWSLDIIATARPAAEV